MTTTTGVFVTELNPKSSGDAAFDSTDSGRETLGSWEGHAVQRTLRQANGSYLVKVQRAVSLGAALRLDDWSFTVEVSN